MADEPRVSYAPAEGYPGFEIGTTYTDIEGGSWRVPNVKFPRPTLEWLTPEARKFYLDFYHAEGLDDERAAKDLEFGPLNKSQGRARGKYLNRVKAPAVSTIRKEMDSLVRETLGDGDAETAVAMAGEIKAATDAADWMILWETYLKIDG